MDNLLGSVWRNHWGDRHEVIAVDGEYVTVRTLDGKRPLGGGATYRWHRSSLFTGTRLPEADHASRARLAAYQAGELTLGEWCEPTHAGTEAR